MNSKPPTGASAIKDNTLKATKTDSKFTKSTFVDLDALDSFNPHRWVGSGTLDSEKLQYQNRVSRVVRKESKGAMTRVRRARAEDEYDSFEDEEEEIYLREKDLAMMAVGFLAFLKSWEAKLISEMERKEAGMEDDEPDKVSDSIFVSIDVEVLTQPFARMRFVSKTRSSNYAKEQKMLRQQLQYLQQQASIQQEGA
eukprot:912694-Rhodomonas_salina.1